MFLEKKITKYLTGYEKITILRSVLLGFTASVCSHGILAIAMELRKKGASTASVISFLLASPWANLLVTFLLLGFFGWKGLLFIFVVIFLEILLASL